MNDLVKVLLYVVVLCVVLLQFGLSAPHWFAAFLVLVIPLYNLN